MNWILFENINNSLFSMTIDNGEQGISKSIHNLDKHELLFV